MITTAIITHFTGKCVQNSHLSPPSVAMISETIQRLKACPFHGKIVVFYDSAKGETAYRLNLEKLCESVGAELNISHGQNYRKHMIHILDNIQTPYLFTLEHDWWLSEPFNPMEIVLLMQAQESVNYVKLWNYHDHTERFRTPPLIEYFEHDLYGERHTRDFEFGLMPDTLWSTNPNISRVEKWRKDWIPMLRKSDAHDANNGNAGGIEEHISRACYEDFKALLFEEAHAKWGLYLKQANKPMLEHVGV